MGKWINKEKRRKDRVERKDRRRAFFRSLFELFTKTIAVTLVTRYGMWIILAIIVFALITAGMYFKG